MLRPRDLGCRCLPRTRSRRSCPRRAERNPRGMFRTLMLWCCPRDETTPPGSPRTNLRSVPPRTSHTQCSPGGGWKIPRGRPRTGGTGDALEHANVARLANACSCRTGSPVDVTLPGGHGVHKSMDARPAEPLYVPAGQAVHVSGDVCRDRGCTFLVAKKTGRAGGVGMVPGPQGSHWRRRRCW